MDGKGRTPSKASTQDPLRCLPDATAAIQTKLPPIIDTLETETSRSQAATVHECLALLQQSLLASKGADPNATATTSSSTHESTHADSTDADTRLPPLNTDSHLRYLTSRLVNHKTAPHKTAQLSPAYDASRPWLVYWMLTALGILGHDISSYASGVKDTLNASQNTTTGLPSDAYLGVGGYGGGHGQASHAATTYAAVLSLASVYGASQQQSFNSTTSSGKEGRLALDIIDRHGLWRWLGQLKQPDGGFAMSISGEEDVRGAYCAMTVIALLNLPLELPDDAPARKSGLETFRDGLPEYLSRCQTFEGGIADRPLTEAHGAFAYCALACLCILGPPEQMLPRYLDLPLLISWLSARQYSPEGGFSGRTNKLVDGCYSHWVGGCFVFIDAALHPSSNFSGRSIPSSVAAAAAASDPSGTPKRSNLLYDKDALRAYILTCAQAPTGGLRDKPSARADAYHTCYGLAGLSGTIHKCRYAAGGGGEIGNERGGLDAAFCWESSSKTAERPESEDETGQELGELHPIFMIPWAAVECTRRYLGGKSWS